jgi:hypothetical protein
VRFGELGIGEVGVRADDVVLADCHGVDLDLVGDALGVAGLEVEPEGASRRLGRKEEGGQEEQRGRGQPLGGSGSGAPRGHRRRSEGAARSRARRRVSGLCRSNTVYCVRNTVPNHCLYEYCSS